jgi:hypothetical protein
MVTVALAWVAATVVFSAVLGAAGQDRAADVVQDIGAVGLALLVVAFVVVG